MRGILVRRFWCGVVTVLFANSAKRQYDADSALNADPLFVLRKYDRKRRKSEICQTFPVEDVVWAQSSGSIILGGGRLEIGASKGS